VSVELNGEGRQQEPAAMGAGVWPGLQEMTGHEADDDAHMLASTLFPAVSPWTSFPAATAVHGERAVSVGGEWLQRCGGRRR